MSLKKTVSRKKTMSKKKSSVKSPAQRKHQIRAKAAMTMYKSGKAKTLSAAWAKV